jgi:uncharacterized secreted protein with C-terminal beta-propeller domain
VITYTYNVTNSGNVDITGPITVTDNKIGKVSIPSTTLAPGANVTGTATYTIKKTDLNTRSVTNTAYATGKAGSKTVTSNTAKATVTAKKPCIGCK